MAFPLFGLKDNAAGRRGFLERLELRVQEESARFLRGEDSGGTIPAVHLEKGVVFWEPGVPGTVVSPAAKSEFGCPD